VGLFEAFWPEPRACCLAVAIARIVLLRAGLFEAFWPEPRACCLAVAIACIVLLRVGLFEAFLPVGWRAAGRAEVFAFWDYGCAFAASLCWHVISFLL
jgi:hypothetical protein